MSCEPITGCVIEDSTFANKARLVDTEEVALLQADIATITWKCWDSAGVLVGSGSLVVATAITDTLLTTGWDADSIGYNFKHTVGDDVCVVACVHSFEYLVTLTGCQSFVTRAFTPDVQGALTS